MKKLVLMSALIFGGFAVKTADAQVGIHINLHLGGVRAYASIPVAAPAPQPEPVYDQPACDDDYYYLPDVEAYYSVPENCYYYQDAYGAWVSAAYLPGYYRDFNWRSVRHFEVRAQRPYLHHDQYRNRFGGWANRDDYYARAYPNRGQMMRDQSYGYNRHHDDRGWGGPRDNGYGRDNGYYRHDDNDNRGNWNNAPRDNGYGQPDQNRGNQGGYNRNNNQNGYNQGGYNRGGNNGQYNNSNGGQGQYDQNRSGQPNGGQPANQNGGGRDRGNYNGGQQQYTRNMGVVNNDRMQNVAMNNRPTRF